MRHANTLMQHCAYGQNPASIASLLHSCASFSQLVSPSKPAVLAGELTDYSWASY